MGESQRVLWTAGLSDDAVSVLESAFGQTARRGVPDQLSDTDCVVLGSDLPRSDREGFVQPFSACVGLKRRGHGHVFIVCDEDETDAAEIARFCLADGVLQRNGTEIGGLDQLRRTSEPASRAPSRVDSLLEKLEGDLAADASGRESLTRRMLERSDEVGLLEQLTDSETGLFNGPFAGFKLDEEIKRANRFHQPLSIVLMDVGIEDWPAEANDRLILLSELAAVFLEGCRDIDVLARFSESVFLFLLPGTGAAGAEALATRLESQLRERTFHGGVRPDAAFGVVTIPQPGIKDRRKLLGLAENCLRQAQGAEPGQRVCVEHS